MDRGRTVGSGSPCCAWHWREPHWRASPIEIDRGGVSYTVDTLRTIRSERPDDELYFLIGADALEDMAHWKEPAEVFRLATPLVVRRAGEREPDLAAVAALCPPERPPILVAMLAHEISSTEIRRRVAAGLPIDKLVPSAVAQYIAEHQVYRH